MDFAEVIQQPGQRELMVRDDMFRSLHVAAPGEIVSFDSESCTATIQLTVRQTKGTDKPPVLVNVPVFTPNCGGAFTINRGDGCLVVFADTCIDGWYQNGGVSNPVSYRSHDLSDGFAFVGFRRTESTTLEERLSAIEQRLNALEGRA